MLAIVYEPRIGLAEPGGATRPAEPSGLRVQPNPFAGSVSLRVRAPGRARVGLRVFDRTGRLVRVVADGVSGAEVLDCKWDGLDAAGQPVPDGVYFVELKVQGGASGQDQPARAATVKVVKLR